MGGVSAGTRIGRAGLAAIVGLAALALVPGIGARLSYHEAIVAQGAREMIAAGAWLVPTLDGRPWVEKPPLLHWLVIAAGRATGEVSEIAARLPSVVAALGVCLGVAALAGRRFGARVGGLAGCVQATVAWGVVRGRLAESDMLLACLVTWTMVALDRLRDAGPSAPGGATPPARTARLFLLLLGLTALAKGIGFGAALILAATVPLLLWDRDRATLRALLDRPGLALAAVVAVAWPLAIAARHPGAVGLWTTHVADRMADRPEVFAGRSPWWSYLPTLFVSTLPWTPFAFAGARRSLGRAIAGRSGPDRLLWAWAVGPVVLLSIASVKNPHYAIHALPPWSIWAALGITRAGDWLEARGRCPVGFRRRLAIVFVVAAAAMGLGFGPVAARFDRRGVEWGFYRSLSATADPADPVVFLYDDWDRNPYPTPFGPVPHDLAVRLYYLERPALWRRGEGRWADLPARPFVAVARERDLDGLARVGQVETLAQGPPARWDRTYFAYRVTPDTATAAPSAPQLARAGSPASE